MTNNDKRDILIIALTIAILLLGSKAYLAANAACESGIQEAKALGCLEFWLNRYQSAWIGFIGAIATLTAAFIAWRAVQRQIFHTMKGPMEAQARQSRLNATALRALAETCREVLAIVPYENGSEFRNVDIVSRANNRRYFPLRLLEEEIFGEIAIRWNAVAGRINTVGQQATMFPSADTDEDLAIRLRQLSKIAPEMESEATRLMQLADDLDSEIARGIGSDR